MAVLVLLYAVKLFLIVHVNGLFFREQLEQRIFMIFILMEFRKVLVLLDAILHQNARLILIVLAVQDAQKRGVTRSLQNVNILRNQPELFLLLKVDIVQLIAQQIQSILQPL
jgi:hypothetical protein